MSNTDRSMTGALVALATGVASLPIPPTKTDNAHGWLLTGTAAYRSDGVGAQRHNLVLEWTATQTIANLRLLRFVNGLWRFIIIAGSGATAFTSLDVVANMPNEWQIDDLGTPERIALMSDAFSGTMTVSIEALEVK